MGIFFDIGSKSYQKVFARPFFYKWNRWLLLCSLNGLGVNNFKISGESAFLKKILLNKKNPILLDVGANIGNWSKEALKINPTSCVYAFEPNPRSFHFLKEIPKIQAHLTAVGKEGGHGKIYLCKEDPTSPLASLNRAAVERLDGEMEEIDVQIMALDDLIEKERIEKVELLKIDVEGNEYAVIEGCQRAIQNGIIDTIQFEFNEMNIFTRHFFHDFQDLLKGFTFYRLLPHSMIPLRHYDPYLKEIFAYQNLVATRQNFQ